MTDKLTGHLSDRHDRHTRPTNIAINLSVILLKKYSKSIQRSKTSHYGSSNLTVPSAPAVLTRSITTPLQPVASTTVVLP